MFDGVCNLCEASVRFIIKHDKKAHFHFASQQSKIGKELLKKYKLEEVNSIVFISNNRAYIYSDSALAIAKHLEGKWKFLTIFRFIPKFIRDAIYKLIAKYRYNFFGKKERCMLPTLEIQSRFLD